MKLHRIAACLAPFLFAACSSPPVRSTVDAFGEKPVEKSARHAFVKPSQELLEQQATQSCAQAARDAGVTVAEGECADCLQVQVRTRLAGTQQVIRSTPGWGASWGIFGGGSAVGLGYGSGSTTSHTEAGREIQVQIFEDAALKKPLREIQVRSVGRENSVVAVAYEMCSAAFRDYPRNLSGAVYEIDVREEKSK